MRARSLVLTAATAALLLAGCGGAEEAPAEAPPAAAATTEEPARTVDPEAPEGGVFADGDDMAHTMCELWTAALDDPSDLRDVADDVSWYASQADNSLLKGELIEYDWGAGDPGYTDVVCKWNGYAPEDGSPSDLLG